MPIDRIVWCHEVEIEDRKFGIIPNGPSYRLFLALRGGEMFDFKSSVADHHHVLLGIAQRPGPRVLGFDQGLARDWEADPLWVTRGIDLLASEGRLDEGPGAVADAAQRAASLPESDTAAVISKPPGMLDWIRNAFDRPGR